MNACGMMKKMRDTMKKKERIKELMKTSPSFVKGAFNTKLSVVLCLVLIFALQGALLWLSQEISEMALVHMGIQVVTVLLMLSGKLIFPLGYLCAMLASLGLGIWLYLPSKSLFYLVQCIFFALNILLMMNLLLNKNAREYRRALKQLKTEDIKTAEPVKMTEEVQEETEDLAETVLQEQPEEKTGIEIICPVHTDFSYGSFSRFLVQHYPFVYLHPQFDIHSEKAQMCILAEGFDQHSEELYSGEFLMIKQQNENGIELVLEYENEMGRLCALICADWLMMQKATLMKDGINVSADLMKQLTEAFVLAQDAEKHPFEGFQKL